MVVVLPRYHDVSKFFHGKQVCVPQSSLASDGVYSDDESEDYFGKLNFSPFFVILAIEEPLH